MQPAELPREPQPARASGQAFAAAPRPPPEAPSIRGSCPRARACSPRACNESGSPGATPHRGTAPPSSASRTPDTPRESMQSRARGHHSPRPPAPPRATRDLRAFDESAPRYGSSVPLRALPSRPWRPAATQMQPPSALPSSCTSRSARRHRAWTRGGWLPQSSLLRQTKLWAVNRPQQGKCRQACRIWQ